MVLQSISAGDSLKVTDLGDFDDAIIEVIDGAEAYLTRLGSEAAESGMRFVPGDVLKLEPSGESTDHIHAVGGDLTYQLTRPGEASSGPERRRINLESRLRQAGVARRLARLQNTAPGADTDMLSTDVSPPEVGTLMLKVVLDGGSVMNVQETIDGTTEAYDLNGGGSLSAGVGYSFTVPGRPDADYNFQVESDVTVSLLQVDYTREVKQ